MRVIALVAVAGILVAAAGTIAARSATSESALAEIDLFNVCDSATTYGLRAELPLDAAKRNASDSVYMTYAGADASKTTVQCQFEGEQVVWHVVEAESPKGLIPQAAEALPATVLSFKLTDAGVDIAPAA